MADPHGVAGVNAGGVAAIAATVLLVALAGAVALTGGVGPLDVGVPGSEPVTTPGPSDTGGTTPADSGGSSAGSGGSSADGGSGGGTPDPPPYDIDVLGMEPCGNTCRDVTVRLRNDRNETAEEVVVHTRIYSGNTTRGDAQVWEGRREVGTLEAGESTTATERVSLSYFEALSVERNGGWVTVVTTVESETVTETFRERREVT